MTARDTLKDSAHFERFMQSKREDIASRNHGPLPGDCYDIMAAMYSAGYPIDDLKPIYEMAISSVDRLPKPIGVTQLLWFGVLLGVDSQQHATLQRIVDRLLGYQAFAVFLADTLKISHPDRIDREGLPKFFPRVRDMATDEERQSYLGEYVRRYWYNANRVEYWWGQHKGGAIRYFGYWAWDVAATVRAYGLDDSSFCDCKYYPVDLAHYLDGK